MYNVIKVSVFVSIINTDDVCLDTDCELSRCEK